MEKIPKKPKFQVLISFFGLLTFLYFYWGLSHFKDSGDLICPIKLPIENPIAQNRKQLSKYLGLGQVVLLSSAQRVERPGSDMELPGWRQPSNIIYLLGKYEISDSLVLVNNTLSGLKVSVFLPNLSEREIVFNGNAPDFDQIKKDYMLDGVYLVNEMPTVLGGLTIKSASVDILNHIPKMILNQLNNTKTMIEYSKETEDIFIQSRFIKTEAELKMLQYSSEAAVFSHKMLDKAIKNWDIITESTLASYFELVSTFCKCRLQAYNPIVGAGKHAGVLHFPTGEDIDGGSLPIDDNSYILVDAAGAYNGYASDVTRTYLKRTDPKKELLIKIVKDANKAGLDAHIIGNKVIEKLKSIPMCQMHQLKSYFLDYGNMIFFWRTILMICLHLVLLKYLCLIV
jgi:Xaa-Pro aminopeptidase